MINSTKKTGDTFSAQEYNNLVVEINNKVDKVEGKKLSSNDYSYCDKSKLDNTYSKNEIDLKLSSLSLVSSDVILSRSEKKIGVLDTYSERGREKINIYSCAFRLSNLDLPKIANQTINFNVMSTISAEDYFAIDSFYVYDTKGRIYPSLYEISDYHYDPSMKLIVTIRCKMENNLTGLTGFFSLKYAKGHSYDELKIRIKSSSAFSFNYAPLKYNKKMLVSMTVDDAPASAFCSLFASIHNRPHTNNDRFYHANQLESGDLPQAVTTNNKTLGITDGCGNERRFRFSVAIWPNSKNSSGEIMMDTTSEVDPLSSNEYRFMTPYLQWDDLNLLLKYHNGICEHNIEGDDSAIDKIIDGVEEDNVKTVNKTGRGLKIIARPDGNDNYISAANKIDNILMCTSESNAVDIYPLSNSSCNLYKKNILRYMPSANGNITDKENFKTDFQAEYAKLPEERKILNFLTHSGADGWQDVMKWINDNYGKDGTDDVWLASLDEIYEYFYFKSMCAISRDVDGSTGEMIFTIRIPYGEYFKFRDMSFIIPELSDTNLITLDINCTHYEEGVGIDYIPNFHTGISDSKVLINVNLNDNTDSLAEEFTAKYESDPSTINRSDAEYFVSFLSIEKRHEYINRIAAAAPSVPVLSSFVVNNGDSTTISTNINIKLNRSGGKPTHYRISEQEDMSNEPWIIYVGDDIQYLIKNNTLGSKSIYIELKNEQGSSSIKSSSITLAENTSSKPVTSILIVGASSVNVGSTLQLLIQYTPSDTSETGVIWTSSDESIATISNGLMTALKTGNVVITAKSSVNNSLQSTKSISITSIASNTKFCILDYNWVSSGKANYIQDTLYGGNVCCANFNLNPAIPTSVYSTDGTLLTDVIRMKKDEISTKLRITIDNFSSTTLYKPLALTGVFSTPIEEVGYAYNYSSKQNCAIGFHVNNGTYRVRLMHSLSNWATPVHSANQIELFINEVKKDITINQVDNTTWQVHDNIVVNDGLLIVRLSSQPDNGFALSAIEVEKI